MNAVPENFLIRKQSGEYEEFSFDKLRASLSRTHAKEKLIEDVVEEVKQIIRPNMTTKEVYKVAFKALQREKRSYAARYNVKRSMMDLGPDGFAFESFIAALFKYKGFSSQTDVVMQGYCVSHEVDVIAERDDERRLVECKFHLQQGTKSDVKTSLYIYARSLDIKEGKEAKPIDQFWLITNTQFSKDAQQYGRCVGLKLMSWNYPKENSLSMMIDKEKLHPLTCLVSLARIEKSRLLATGIVLCRDLYNNDYIMNSIGLSPDKMTKVNEEIADLLNGNHY